MTRKISLILTLTLITFFSCIETLCQTKKVTSYQKPTMAILPLVNLKSEQPLPELTKRLRSTLQKLQSFNIMDIGTQNKKLIEYNHDLSKPCNSKECAFELGGLLETNYILFGSASRFNDMGLVTIKILDLKESKIIWSRALTSHHKRTAIENTFVTLYKELIQTDITTIRNNSEKTLAVLDFSENSLQSKILFERILTHAYKFGYADVMSPEEVKEMITALDIKKETVLNSIETILTIGENLGVSAVLYTNLSTTGINLKHQIALFDVTEKSVILSMPPLPKASFTDVLFMERHFFTSFSNIVP